MIALFLFFWRLAWVSVLCLFVTSAIAQRPVKQWDRSFGGDGYDGLQSMQQTLDGGYILGGFSSSNISGDKTQACQGREDYWVVKVDGQGSKQWERTFGGDNWDYLQSMQQTTDGGYILGGYSDSGVSGDRSVPSQPSPSGLSPTDYWLVKLDAQGNKQWDRAYGGSGTDLFSSLQQTADGGYILGGKSYSTLSGDQTQPSRGGADFWVIKVDAQGNKQWDRALGGQQEEALTCLQHTRDGGYILGGFSMSGISGDRTKSSRGGNDFWVIKLDNQGNQQWDQAYGGQ